MSDASRDGKLVALQTRFGWAGIGRWWHIVERVSEQYNGGDPAATFHFGRLALDLAFRRKMFRSYLEVLQELSLISATINGELLIISIPNLKKIKDNYQKDLQATCKRLASIEEEVEEEVEKKKKPPPSPPEGGRRVKPNRTKPVETDEFLDFYQAYPRHVAKASALKAWSKLDLSNGLLQKIMAGVSTYAKACEGKEPQHIAHPATWLNGRRWEDEPEKSVVRDNPAKPKGSEYQDIRNWKDGRFQVPNS